MAWRPPSFLDFHKRLASRPEEAARDLDTAVGRIYQKAESIPAMGSVSVTGSLKRIATGLTTVTQCSGTIDNGTTAHAFSLTVTPSSTAGCIDIYVWMPTGAAVTTPIAATSKVTVRWVAQGTI